MKTNPSNKSKPRLGRGLSSLISVTDELPVEAEVRAQNEPNSSDGIGNEGTPGGTRMESAAPPPPKAAPAEISIDAITVNPHQPRRQFNETSLAELAASIRSSGVIQPIIVRKYESGYQLIAGERRWRAARQAGLYTIPAIVRDVDSFKQAQMALIENIQREDLNPIDRAQGYRALIQQLGLTQAELATRLGEDRSSIANFTRLLDLAAPVRELIRDGQLSVGHAKLLAGVADLLEQERLANLVVAQELSVRNLERLLQTPTETPSPRTAASPSAHLADLEKSIARQLGMRVQVRATPKGNKGRLTIHYASLDQFDELMSKLGVALD